MEPVSAIIFADQRYRTPDAKTAHGLVRGGSRYRIKAVVDASAAGYDAGEVLDGVRRDIPIVESLSAAIAAAGDDQPRFCVVGIATAGGVLPVEVKRALLQALELGLSIVCGLHEYLASDPVLVAAASAHGLELVDIRRPPPKAELHFWSGRILGMTIPRVAVLGTDCAIGKRTTARLVVEACRQAGLRAEMIYTGQTGWLQGGRYGLVLDSIPNDFVSGELEHALLHCAAEARPDVMVIEGQSSLRNPSGPCGSEILLSANARQVILQHAPGRRYFDGFEALRLELPAVADEIELISRYGARTLAVTLNSHGVEPAARDRITAGLERELGLPVVWPLEQGVSRLVPLLEQLVSAA